MGDPCANNSDKRPCKYNTIGILSTASSDSNEVLAMKNEYTAVVKQEGDGWMGWFEEIPGVHCQGKSY